MFVRWNLIRDDNWFSCNSIRWVLAFHFQWINCAASCQVKWGFSLLELIPNRDGDWDGIH